MNFITLPSLLMRLLCADPPICQAGFGLNRKIEWEKKEIGKVWGNIVVLSGVTSLLAGLVSLVACDNTKQAETTWTRQFDTSGNDDARAAVVDGAGHIYVAGWTDGTFSGQPQKGSRLS